MSTCCSRPEAAERSARIEAALERAGFAIAGCRILRAHNLRGSGYGARGCSEREVPSRLLSSARQLDAAAQSPKLLPMSDSSEQPALAGRQRGDGAAAAQRLPARAGDAGESAAADGVGSMLPEVRVSVEGSLVEPRWELPAKLGRSRSVPAVVLPAVAAGSFAAGLALAELLHRSRRSARGRAGALLGLREGDRRSRNGLERMQIVGSRSLLLDVHLLGRAARER